MAGSSATKKTKYLIFLTAACYVTTVVLNALAGSGKGGVFSQSTGNVSNNYSTFITPAGWAFSIWGFIYIWLGLGIGYCVSTVFRRNAKGPVYQSPPSLTWTFYLTYSVNFGFNIGWLFVWDAANHAGSAVLIVLIAYTGWLSIVFASSGLKNHEGSLTRMESLLQKYLVQNGIAVYATWTTVASMLNIAIAVQYVGGYSAEDACIGPLCVLVLILLAWFILENTLLDNYFRHIVMQYPVVIYAVAAILNKQMKTEGVPFNVFALTCAVETLAAALLVARIAILVYKQIKGSPSQQPKN